MDVNSFKILNESILIFRERIREKEEEKVRSGKVIVDDPKRVDGPLVRLKEYKVNYGSHSLELYLQETSWIDYVATNRSLKEDFVWNMVVARGADIRNLDDGLANPIGCVSVTLTSDRHVILNRRSERAAVYPGLYGILPAGYSNPEEDNYNPFNTVKREGKEELGVEIKEPNFWALEDIAMIDILNFCFFLKYLIQLRKFFMYIDH